jgi:hypothetical protein
LALLKGKPNSIAAHATTKEEAYVCMYYCIGTYIHTYFVIQKKIHMYNVQR